MKYQVFFLLIGRYMRGIFFLAAIQLLNLSVFAQGGIDYGDKQVQSAFAHAVKTYDNVMGRNEPVYSGQEYYSPHVGISGTPFFIDEYWTEGNVVYNDSQYDSISIKYDIFSDRLIVENFALDGLPAPVLLYKPKVGSFQIHGYDFVRIDGDTLSKIKGGYYNLMYDGDLAKLLIKRRKEIIRFNDVNAIRQEFKENNKYFIEKGGEYYSVKKKNSVLKVLENKKKELKSFIRSNGLKFKGNTDIELAQVLEYYNSLF